MRSAPRDSEPAVSEPAGSGAVGATPSGATPVDATSSDATSSGAAFDRRLIAPMIVGSILNPVNSSMIAVALIPIGAYFGAPPTRTAWLVSGLYVATAIGQPLVGRLVDAFGPRRLYLAGAALVGAAGVLSAVAPNLATLVAARVLLGFGTCAGYPAAMFLIRREADRTGRDSPAGILTVLAVATQTIAVVGPTVGGLLIGVGGWRAIFAVNVPLAAACLVLGVWRLPREGTPQRREPQASAPGAAIWGNRPLLATYGRTLLSYVVSYSFLYGFTQWLEEGRGLSAARAGLILLPVFATGILVSTLTGRSPRVRGKLLVGATAQVLACGLVLAAGPGSPIWLLVLIGAVLGVPQGLNSLANQNALYHQADPARIGSSSGLLRTFTYAGAIVASGATGAFFGARADTRGLHELAVFLLAVAVVFLLLTLSDRSLGRIGSPSPG